MADILSLPSISAVAAANQKSVRTRSTHEKLQRFKYTGLDDSTENYDSDESSDVDKYTNVSSPSSEESDSHTTASGRQKFPGFN